MYREKDTDIVIHYCVRGISSPDNPIQLMVSITAQVSHKVVLVLFKTVVLQCLAQAILNLISALTMVPRHMIDFLDSDSESCFDVPTASDEIRHVDKPCRVLPIEERMTFVQGEAVAAALS